MAAENPLSTTACFRSPGFAVRLLGWILVGCVSQGFALNAQQGISGADPVVAKEMRDALAAAQRGDGTAALRTVQDLLQIHPRFVPALKLQGMVLEDAGNGEGAAESYEKALKLAPTDADLLLKVGVFALVKGDADRAITLLTKRAQLVPRDEESFYYLAQAYHRKGEDEFALKAIRKANMLTPNSAPIEQKYGELLCSSGDNVEALRWLTKAQTADPSLARIDLDLAIASYNNMDLDQAVAYASIETGARPNELDAFALLAAAKIKLRQWADAKPALEHVLAARKDDPQLLLELGHCEVELHEYQNAVDTLGRALEADPTQAQAHFFLSRADAGLGKTAEAQHESELHQRMLQEISFEVPKAEQQAQAALVEQARALLTAHREADAIHLFEEDAKRPHGLAANPYVSVGATYLSMGDADSATRSLEHALQIDPKSKGAHSYLGIMALQQGDLLKANQEFEAELDVDPNHPLALAELGEVRYRQEKWSEAADLFAKSKTTTPRFLYMLTDSDFHLGRIHAANLTAESLAAYARDQAEVMQGLTELLTRNGQTELAKKLQAEQHP